MIITIGSFEQNNLIKKNASGNKETMRQEHKDDLLKSFKQVCLRILKLIGQKISLKRMELFRMFRDVKRERVLPTNKGQCIAPC